MFFYFLENMALIIALIYLALKGRELLLVNWSISLGSQWLTGIFIGFLSFAVMHNPLPYEGLRLDLREAPLFFIAYVGGWRSGLVAAVLPAIYRTYLGGPFVPEGVFHSIILPVLIGALFHDKAAYRPPLTVIDTKRMVTGLLVFEVLKSVFLLFTTPATLSIVIIISFFAIVAVVTMGLMLNDAHRNILSRKELEFQSSRDPMTQLPNIRSFKQQVEQLIAKNVPLSIVMFDVDHFKDYNDTHGHQQGDEVLRTLARILIDNVRKDDLVARYGGEEFIICFPGLADSQAAIVLAERFRKTVELHRFEGEKTQPGGGVTISLGISSSFGQKPLTVIIEEADRALYESKSKGRNRVTVFAAS